MRTASTLMSPYIYTYRVYLDWVWIWLLFVVGLFGLGSDWVLFVLGYDRVLFGLRLKVDLVPLGKGGGRVQCFIHSLFVLFLLSQTSQDIWGKGILGVDPYIQGGSQE